ncbi:hypothetical protein MSAN_01927300 [Mycena sanguinolenta]|uniref:Uncharacterized protein n=1 Tax=Mycena sanguinolenta TaxID=230812 RepID=A0A8H7CQF4_9AGAR|nr:hypothetical protein MSAN_01927300 [Mycena sanguinolenta]
MILVAFTVFFDLYSTPDAETRTLSSSLFSDRGACRPYMGQVRALLCAFIVEGEEQIISDGGKTHVFKVIMQIRLHALYGHNKQLIFAVSLLCIGELMSMASLSLIRFPTSSSGLAQVPNTTWTLPFCNNVIPDHFYPYWIAFMIFDTIIFFLVVRRAYMHYETLLDKSWTNTTLMTILVRDSVFYFLCNVVVFLGTTLLWRYGPQGLATIANSWSLVVPSTSAGRLLLNMRHAHKPSSDHISTTGLSGLGSLHIVSPESHIETVMQQVVGQYIIGNSVRAE